MKFPDEERNIKISDEAKQIALILFPEDFVEDHSIKGFRMDNNAGRRDCAEIVAEHFLSVLHNEKTIEYVMRAFYRREHGEEPKVKDFVRLKAAMSTSLLAYVQQLKLKEQGLCPVQKTPAKV